MNIILASASPRRKKLLEQINLPFEVRPSALEEHVNPTSPPDEVVTSLASQKGEDIARNHVNSLVIAADTIVYFRDLILGKPNGPDEARKMLKDLSGNTHDVYSGVFLAKTGPEGIIEKSLSFSERTKVTFSALTDHEINRYIQSGNPLDKAGAYGIQDDLGALFVEKIEGDYNNVVGFPLHSFYQNLKSEFPDLYSLYFTSAHEK